MVVIEEAESERQTIRPLYITEIELCECVNCKPVTISRAIAGQMVWRVYQLEMLYDILARDNRSQALAFVLDVHND